MTDSKESLEETFFEDTPAEEMHEVSQVNAPVDPPETITMYTVLHGRMRSWTTLTFRGKATTESVDKYIGLLKHASEKYGLQTYMHSEDIQGQPQQQPTTIPPGNPKKPPVPRDASMPVSPSASAPQMPGNSGGSGRLLKINCDQAKGGVEFYVEGLKWPIIDRRKPEIISGLFDANLGWTSDHFYPGAFYDLSGADFAMTLTWMRKEKNGRTYYDVVKVSGAA